MNEESVQDPFQDPLENGGVEVEYQSPFPLKLVMQTTEISQPNTRKHTQVSVQYNCTKIDVPSEEISLG
jgi:hypothetical protein